jgi:hypothetical protein
VVLVNVVQLPDKRRTKVGRGSVATVSALLGLVCVILVVVMVVVELELLLLSAQDLVVPLQQVFSAIYALTAV